MAKTQIQQFLEKKSSNLIFAASLLLILLNSCVNLRYTDYGRPFDFVKAKNQHFAHHKTEKDTANVYTSVAQEEKSTKIIVPVENISETVTFQNIEKEVIVEQKELTEEEVVIPKNVFERSHVPDYKNTLERALIYPKMSPKTQSETAQANGWWEDFWEGLWNFFVKWLLLVLVFFVLLALIIWGLFFLITLIAGAWAAGIFLGIVLVLFAILMFAGSKS